MKKIKKNELFRSLSGFLKVKGVELKDGTYTQHIRSACNLLGDAINATQRTASRARKEVGTKLDQFRQHIHKATAPESQPKAARKKSPKKKTAKRKQPVKRAKARKRS